MPLRLGTEIHGFLLLPIIRWWQHWFAGNAGDGRNRYFFMDVLMHSFRADWGLDFLGIVMLFFFFLGAQTAR